MEAEARKSRRGTVSIEEERAQLIELGRLPWPKRILGYFAYTGPGFLQSAMTLGGGTAGACLLAGSLYGYKLLWVQPVAMVMGALVLAAVAKQTVNTGERPYRVFWNRLHPSLAILWAVSALLASVIWHFPQYSLGVTSATEALGFFGLPYMSPWPVAVVILSVATYITWNYDKGRRGVRVFEMAVKTMVWAIVIAFGIVAVASGIDWGALWSGFFGFYLPIHDPKGMTVVIGALGAAVGVNMLFLYPYSLLKRDWGREHEGLAYFDLITGMMVPYILATIFIIVGTANTLHRAGAEATSLMSIVPVLSPALGEKLSALVLGVGLFAIALSTITLHMLASAFICAEMFGRPATGWSYRLFSLIPAVGILGAGVKLPFWAAVLASSVAVALMPIAMVCFLILNNSIRYMKDALPRGERRWLWNAGLIGAILIITVAGVWRFSMKFRSASSTPPTGAISSPATQQK